MWPLTGKEIYELITKDKNNESIFTNIIIEGVCTDSRKIKSYHLFIAIEGDQFDGHAYLNECFEKGVKIALVNKESKYLNHLNHTNRKKCIEVSNVLDNFRDLAKYFRKYFSFPVIGVGGSNGKTTTKEMLACLLSGGNSKVTKTEKSENGFLGIALTLCQEQHNVKNPPSVLVLEIGIDDVGAMAQHVELGMPTVSLITALGPEHLEHLINWETAAAEELILFKNSNTKRIWQFADQKIVEAFEKYNKEQELKSDHAVSTLNDFIVIEKNEFSQNFLKKQNILKYVSSIVIWELLNNSSIGSELKFEVMTCDENLNALNNKLRNISFHIPLPGFHNAANFALAFASALLLKKSIHDIELGWSNFIPPPMRSKVTTLNNGAILFDDSYNSSPMSLEAALNSLNNKEWIDKKKLVVLGDMLDLGFESKYWHEKIILLLKNLQNTYLCLYGSAMYDCYKLLKETEDTLISTNNTKLFWLAANEEPSKFLSGISELNAEFVILVKGSRGMKLDRFVKTIEEKYC
jgi:UDP-N-acetylmuramoyl-tripeptide--D-alanyl-D-alanine ligase